MILEDLSRIDFLTFANSVRHFVWLADGEGRARFCNKAWYDFTGQTPAEIARDADAWSKAIHADDLAETMALWADALVREAPFRQEYRIRRADGEYRWFLGNSFPMRDENGRVVAWAGIATDIHEHEEREAAFARFADTIPQLMWSAEADGDVTYYSKQFLEYAQCRTSDIRGWDWDRLVHPDDMLSAVQAWSRSLQTGEPLEAECRLRRMEDGTYRWFLVRALPYWDAEGKIAKWFGTSTDIDAQKRHTQQQESIAAALTEVFQPKTLPQAGILKFDAVYVPAGDFAKVGGDFFDAMPLPDGRIMFSIGDVTGHGLAAAVTMGRVRNAIIGAAIDAADPAVVLARVNRILRIQEPETFVTAIVGFAQPGSGEFRYACAGHPAPLLVRDGDPRMLPIGGVPLGVIEDPVFSTHDAGLGPGDMLVLYTDGITEYDRNPILGEGRLLRAAVRAAFEHPPEPASYLYQLVLGDRKSPDDIALLTIAYD